MNNITKALAYLLIIFLLLTAGGYYYHKTDTKVEENNTPINNNNNNNNVTPDVPVQEDNTDEFISQSRAVVQNAISQWNAESATEKSKKTYCNVEGCASGVNNILDGYLYNIVVNEEGKVTSLYITNSVYQYVYIGDNLVPENINVATKISDINPEAIVTIKPEM